MLIYNLFDDWLDSYTSFTCFSRLVLIMRALHVDTEKTWSIFKSYSSRPKPPANIWPNLTADEWPKAEIELKNLILADFAKKCNINIASLT